MRNERADKQSQHRRRFVQAVGSAVAVGLAGCLGGDSQGNEAGGSSGGPSTGTPTAGGESTATTATAEEGHDEAIGEPTDRAEVSMVAEGEDNHFEPHVVRVTPGGTVRFVNEQGAHSTTAYHPDNDKPLRIPEGASAWDSGTLSEQGATFEHTFETEGVYDYFCIPHESMGMLGSVIVGQPDPQGQPALQPPQESLPGEASAKIEELNEMVAEELGGATSQ